MKTIKTVTKDIVKYMRDGYFIDEMKLTRNYFDETKNYVVFCLALNFCKKEGNTEKNSFNSYEFEVTKNNIENFHSLMEHINTVILYNLLDKFSICYKK